MNRSFPRLASVLVLLLLPVLAACGSGAATGDKGYIDGRGVVTEIAVMDRKPVETISGTTLTGEDVDLADLAKGRPVVVNVWASWCAPCRAETKALVAAAKQLGDKAVFLGINVRDPGGTAKGLAFERKAGVPYPSLYDPSGRTLLAFPRGVSPYSIPSTLVIDTKGRVGATVLGQMPSTRTLVELVEDVDAGAGS